MDAEKRAKNNAKQKRYYERKINDPIFKEKERLRQKKIRNAKAKVMTKKEKKKQMEAARERQNKMQSSQEDKGFYAMLKFEFYSCPRRFSI